MKLINLRQRALNLLARREHSCFEMRRKLLAKEDASVAAVDALLNSLVQEGLLSDERFTEAYIHMRCARGYGPLRIREELKERGISATLLAQYLDDSAEIWHEKLDSVWRKRFAGKEPKDFAESTRQMRFLQYRGFDAPQIRAFFKKMAAF